MAFDITKEFEVTNSAENGKKVDIGEGATVTIVSLKSTKWKKAWAFKRKTVRVDTESRRKKALNECMAEHMVLEHENLVMDGEELPNTVDARTAAFKKSENFTDFIWSLAADDDTFADSDGPMGE